MINILKIFALLLALFLDSSFAAKLDDSMSITEKMHADSLSSQQKIDAMYAQINASNLSYETTKAQLKSITDYNIYLNSLIQDQNKIISKLTTSIDSSDGNQASIAPLMQKMIVTLHQFINSDLPFNLDNRHKRIKNLEDLLGKSNLTTADKLDAILDAYSIELAYGENVSVYANKILTDNQVVMVDCIQLGRVALYAITPDRNNAFIYNPENKIYEKLNDSYLEALTQTIKIVKNENEPKLLSFPIPIAKENK